MFDDQKVTITKCDNGYVLEWSKPDFDNSFSASTGRKKTSGTEVHSTLKKVMDAAKARL